MSRCWEGLRLNVIILSELIIVTGYVCSWVKMLAAPEESNGKIWWMARLYLCWDMRCCPCHTCDVSLLRLWGFSAEPHIIRTHLNTSLMASLWKPISTRKTQEMKLRLKKYLFKKTNMNKLYSFVQAPSLAWISSWRFQLVLPIIRAGAELTPPPPHGQGRSGGGGEDGGECQRLYLQTRE